MPQDGLLQAEKQVFQGNSDIRMHRMDCQATDMNLQSMISNMRLSAAGGSHC